MIITNRKTGFPAEKPVIRSCIKPYSLSDSEAVILDFTGHHQPPPGVSTRPETAGDRLSFCPPL